MPKLNQIVAVEKGTRSRADKVVSELYSRIQKPDLFAGITRTYKSKDDEGDQYPSESTLVQAKAEDVLKTFAGEFTKIADIVLTKETGNTFAKADIKVDGGVLLTQVPITYLLFLEKWLNDISVFITKLPVLDPAEKWEYSEDTGSYRNETQDTKKTKKVPRVLVKYEATDKHPAQVETWYEDVLEGYWSTTKLSGKIPQDTKKQLLDRIEVVRSAVKFAREEANSLEVTDYKVGEQLFAYLFSSLI